MTTTSPAGERIIHLQQVCLQRSGVSILRGVDWTVRRGENWALLGLNGSGKTSLLRCATGDFWPTSGRVELLGGELGKVDLPALKKRVGWVGGAIDKWLLPSETVRRLVVTGLHHTYEIYREPTAEESARAQAALENLGAGYLGDRLYGKLSQGEQQKARLARALVSEPELLVLDELCAGLDIRARESVLAAVERMSVPSILFVTHHIEEIPVRVNRALAIREGQVVACGPKEQVLTSQTLSEVFGLPVRVNADAAGRYWAQVAHDATGSTDATAG